MVTKEAKTETKETPGAAATPAPKNVLSPCRCSTFSVLVNLRKNPKDGDLIYDEELTTGCAGAKTKSDFLPGHDAKLKSALIRWGAAGHEIQEDTGGVTVVADALTHAKQFGFDHMVAAGLKRAEERAADKLAGQQAKALKASAPKAKKQTPAAKPLAEVVASEETTHKEAEVKKVAEREATAEWSESSGGGEGETVVELTGRKEVMAKVGRWEYKGVISDAGWLHYLAKDGQTKKTAQPGKFEVLREV